MPHATPLPIAEKAKAAIARQEAIEKKCAQAIEHFDLDSSPEGEQAAIAVAKDIVAAFAIADVRVSLRAGRGGLDPFQHPLVAGKCRRFFSCRVLPCRCFGMSVRCPTPAPR